MSQLLVSLFFPNSIKLTILKANKDDFSPIRLNTFVE